MSKPNQLFLLADHIKLSLLERQRAKTLNLESDAQDGHISRSLDQLRDGLSALKDEEARLRAAGDQSAALTIADSLSPLQKQHDDLTSQFHGFSSPSTLSTLTHPNDPSLSSSFAHASTLSSSKMKSSLRSPSLTSPKTVRFTDSPIPSDPSAAPDLEAQLFGPYRDDPHTNQYQDQAAEMTNQQIHAYHDRILAEQDEHLDRLGESIGRQRELSMQIGDELDNQVEMLEETDGLVHRHQGRLDRATKSLGRIARGANENKGMTTIVVLIVILVLLIAVFK